MYTIEISNRQACLAVDEDLLRDVVQKTLEAEGVAGAEISIAVVDNRAIRRLNKQYLGRDRDTDVLSFRLHAEEPASAGRGTGKRIEGEVVISAEKAVERAPDFDWTPPQELVLYLVHGLLHLVGYDDLTETQRQVMRSRERELLKRWNLASGADF